VVDYFVVVWLEGGRSKADDRPSCEGEPVVEAYAIFFFSFLFYLSISFFYGFLYANLGYLMDSF